jgi:serine/threonine protein kinase
MMISVWSFGVVVWELLAKNEPYEDVDVQVAALSILQGETLEIPPSAPPPLYEIMKRCWDLKPSSRPTFRELYLLFRTLVDNCPD